MEEGATFGYWIRRLRKARDLTQTELATRVGVSVAMIRRLEADERRPSKEVAARLAQVLAIPVEDQATFLKVARAELAADHLPLATIPVVPVHSLPLPTTSRRQCSTNWVRKSFRYQINPTVSTSTINAAPPILPPCAPPC